MARLFMAAIVFAMAMAVLKMVLLALIIAGLIFRPKETLGLMVIGGVFSLFKANFFLGLGCVGLLILGAIYTASVKARSEALKLPNDASP